MIKAGDHIRIIDEVGDGKVLTVSRDIATVDIDGFTFEFPLHRLVKVEFDNLINPDKITQAKEHSDKLEQIQQRTAVEVRMDSLRTVYELDLHIEELTDRYHHLNNGDILSMQMRRCRQFIQEAHDKRYRKVVLIHGRGEGVLKMEIHTYLDRFQNVEYHDAPHRTYGYGATEVIFHR